MLVDVRHERGILLVEPVGELDGKTAPEFQDQVLDLVQPQARIVINLGRVAFMSSAGLRSLLIIYRAAQAKDVRVVLTEVTAEIRTSMSATGFLSFFVVHDTTQAGLEALG